MKGKERRPHWIRETNGGRDSWVVCYELEGGPLRGEGGTTKSLCPLCSREGQNFISFIMILESFISFYKYASSMHCWQTLAVFLELIIFQIFSQGKAGKEENLNSFRVFRFVYKNYDKINNIYAHLKLSSIFLIRNCIREKRVEDLRVSGVGGWLEKLG